LKRSDIESVGIVKESDNTKIQIKLKSEAAGFFADATRNNLNKAIAIVIDEKVYSFPVVRDPIESGNIEVTGKFAEREVGYFPALFNSDQLPVTFKVIQ